MNARQAAFHRQAASDWEVYCHFRPLGSAWRTALRRRWCALVGVRPFSFPVCHELHYLQMCTEKLAKAYYPAPPSGRISHNAFRQFLTHLPSNARAFKPLGFADLAGFTRWQLSVTTLVGAIEDLAPALAGNGPNPEYPWPRNAPTNAPADHSFQNEIYNLLHAQTTGSKQPFLVILGRMVETMRSKAWHL